MTGREWELTEATELGSHGRPPKQPTIYDVAQLAGVAPSTVSRAFARPGRVKAETAERIRQVAAEVGYRVNPLALGVQTGRTSMLALVVSDVTNPFYAEIIRGAESAAAEAGYVLVLMDAQESRRMEHDSLNRSLSVVEGIILAGSRLSDSDIRMMAKQRPLVVLNRDVAGVPGIVPNIPQGTWLAAEHLARHDHRSLTYVAGPEASWADGMRWVGLRAAAAKLGQRVHRMGPFAPTVAGGRAAARRLLQDPPTAVVAYNDQLAIGLTLALQANGVRVPDDVSVIGFDNIFTAKIVTPALTTVVAPLRAQGRTAVHIVLASGAVPRRRAGQPITLPVKLVVRNSTAPARRGRAVAVPPVTPGG